jgi:carboxypeptidase Taq
MAWDRQVLMPPGGAPARTAHTAALSSMLHQERTSEELRSALEQAALEIDPSSEDAATVRVLQREISIHSKLPADLVEAKAKVSSDAYEKWRQARAQSDFNLLSPYLERLFDIARETANLLGHTDHIYDPLVDLFEEGATYEQAKAMFDAMKGPIRELVELAPSVDTSFLYGEWNTETLVSFAGRMARQIGFDFDKGRLDPTTNAFCSNMSSADVRMTTRPARHFGGILFSTLHEMGHGLYEQGSPSEWDRTPLAGGISLGVHESQSRTWENIVGRSYGFWRFFYPQLQEALPAFAAVDLATFYQAVNQIEPGPIRIGSDELTYNLHILVRFELECEILTNEVEVRDLPEAWNEKYRAYLGIVPKNDAEGCLQDVHWSRGSVGYFPTYAMGNMIGWQIWHRLEKDIPNTEDLMAAGNFERIHAWLREHVYSQGRRYRPTDLLMRVTGKAFGPDDYIAGMRAKYGTGLDVHNSV